MRNTNKWGETMFRFMVFVGDEFGTRREHKFHPFFWCWSNEIQQIISIINDVWLRMKWNFWYFRKYWRFVESETIDFIVSA